MLPLVRHYISPSLHDLSLTHSPPKQHFQKITCKSLQPVEVQPEIVPIIEEDAAVNGTTSNLYATSYGNLMVSGYSKISGFKQTWVLKLGN